MKQTLEKMAAVLLGSSMMCSAMLLPATAAEDPADTVTMTAVITLSGTTATAEGENVTIDGSTIQITASGDYEISGKLDDGQIVVNVADLTADTGTVKLHLNGVNITGTKDAPLLIENAENTTVDLVKDSENFLYDGETYSATTAVIYAKDDITFKGEGKLRIEAAYQQGLHCNNDVKINGGNIKVKTELEDGIRGKKSVQIKSGILDVNAGGDGVKSTKGDVLISGGSIEIKAGNDAVQGETSVQISGGSLKANGDRGIKNVAGAVKITGGTILATATDEQTASVDSVQPVVMFQTTAEQVKDQMIALTGADDTAVFEMNPDKKFDFVLISSPELTVGTNYSVQIGGKKAASFVLSTPVMTLDAVEVPADVAATDFDINGDTNPNVLDAVILARIVAEDTTLEVDSATLERSDINHDGVTNIEDTTLMLKFLAHKL